MHWQRARRDGDMPFPRPSDLNELFEKFSPETQKTIEAAAANKMTSEPEDQRTPQRQQALEQERVGELVRMALWARYFPQISLEELLKYYAAMKSDDPRRKLVQGKEGEELRRELQRMYNLEHMAGRGGPPGGRVWSGRLERSTAGRGDGRGSFRSEDRRPEDRGKPGDRSEGRDRGSQSPPGERSPPAEPKTTASGTDKP